MKKDLLITIGVIVIVIIFAVIILTLPQPDVEKSLAKCIGENSILYIQTGCIHCEDQLDLFGEDQKHLNIYNCMDDNWRTCRDLSIIGTPTWIINDTRYVGKQSLETLKKFTEC